MLKRSAAWDWASLGLFYSATAYNIYIASLACYIAQLEDYPLAFRSVEECVLRRAAAGPYRWAMPEDLFRLKDLYGQSMNFRDLRTTAIAAKVRVSVYENSAHGGLRINERAVRLRHIWVSAERPGMVWHQWIQANPIFVLEAARQQAADMDLAPGDVMMGIANHTPLPWNAGTFKSVRRKFQSTMSQALRKKSLYNEQERMRNKLRRWKMPGRPAIIAARAVRRLQLLNVLTPPRVCAAMLSTLWNRWTTRRRFQQRGKCVLLCSETAVDCIEHYAGCPAVRNAGRRHLNLHLRPWPNALPDFLGVAGPPLRRQPSDSELARGALLVYATYVATNAARHKSPANMLEAEQMIHQAILEGAKGHEKCARFLREAFPARR